MRYKCLLKRVSVFACLIRIFLFGMCILGVAGKEEESCNGIFLLFVEVNMGHLGGAAGLIGPCMCG